MPSRCVDGLRLETVTYPKTSRVVFYGYGDTGPSANVGDRLSRVQEIRETSSGGTQLSFYAYNGTIRLISTDYPVPQVQSPGYAFGSYFRYDRFGRVARSEWDKNGSGAGFLDLVNYGYDYAGNRTWREDVQAAANSKDYDEFYTYDGLHRLKSASRGNLTGSPSYTGVTSANLTQDWTLDQLGNWPGFTVTDGTSTTLNQTRYHNAVNEIAGNGGSSITGTPDWADTAYDAAGNMTAIPQPANPAGPFYLRYDAWNRLILVAIGLHFRGTDLC